MVSLDIVKKSENVESYVKQHDQVELHTKNESENRLFVVVKQNNTSMEDGVPLGSIGVTDSEFQVFIGRNKESGYRIDTYHSSYSKINQAVDSLSDELDSMHIQG